MPVSAAIVSRFVAGETADEAVEATRRLSERGLVVTIDHLGEYTSDRSQAGAAVRAYQVLLDRLATHGLARGADVSVKLSALGLLLGNDGEQLARDNAAEIASAAAQVGAFVTVDMEDHTTVDATLSVVTELRREFPDVGAVLQARLQRTEGDCRDLAYEGSRVRLCKGAYSEPESVAFQKPAEVDRSFVRCLRILMDSPAYPMMATHDPRLVEIGGALAMRHGREQGSYEYQMLYGIRPAEQRRLAGLGELMRVYVPYGDQWYGYLMRRLAERPANVGFFLRSLATRS